MRILVVSYDIPKSDQSSGELRFYLILKMLATTHDIEFFSLDYSKELFNPDRNIDNYKKQLEEIPVCIRYEQNIYKILRHNIYDVVFFEHYFTAEKFIDSVRVWQPNAAIVVDSVDVHFNRHLSKALLTKDQQDYLYANEIKERELMVYSRSDLVIVVSQSDKDILTNELASLVVSIIPNIHKIYMPMEEGTPNANLIFIGSFLHAPNVDAMLYFTQEVLPLITEKVPDVRLKIIGSAPTEIVKNLATECVDVVGYVPETAPYLAESSISIAPLRFGGGIKGKIGEAMAFGLPVVTTSIGIEGFGLSPGENVMVGDSPQEFANGVIALINDRELHNKIRYNGWKFIKSNYSDEVIGRLVYEIFNTISLLNIKKMSSVRRFVIKIPYFLDAHLLWRFKCTI